MSAAERGHLARLVRGHRPLRAVRRITDEVYRLFDRRCRTDTALAKVAVLRTRVKRYRRLGRSRDKLRSPTRGTALEFLDDTLLPATSNAVERSNRRHRKMRRSVDGVRTQENLEGRLALDLQRERPAAGRQETLQNLHQQRAEGK